VPELPDITIYVEALGARILHQRLVALRVLNPFVLRTFDPPITESSGREVVEIGRSGKRIVIGLDGELFIVIHLMIAGRLRWLSNGKAAPKKLSLAALEFAAGTLILTEAGTTRRCHWFAAGKRCRRSIAAGSTYSQRISVHSRRVCEARITR
jgi:formamidopyrimidine-DNA glycosylase